MNRVVAADVPADMIDPPPPPVWNPDPRDRIVEVAACANEPEAAILSSALADAGIPHRVVGGLLNSVSVDFRLGAEMKPAVWTLDRDAAAAREVVSELRAEYRANRLASHEEE